MPPDAEIISLAIDEVCDRIAPFDRQYRAGEIDLKHLDVYVRKTINDWLEEYQNQIPRDQLLAQFEKQVLAACRRDPRPC